MAEIILPPEENEETPQVPELNIDKPSGNSKIITIEFEAKKTNKVSTKDTNQQLYTTDTDAWFEFKETSLEGANGTYSVVFRNRHDGSIFQRTGDVVNGVAYYKIPHQEVRHAGTWRGQIVYTLSNGDTTSREFGYDVKGHILDGKDVREIVVEDFETLMSQLRSMKDNAESELANLTQELRNATDTAEQNETDRQAFFVDLVEDIDGLQANYQELLDTGVLQTNINTKLEALEEEYAPKLTEVTAQLQQTEQSLSSQLAHKANQRDVILKSEGIGLDDAKADLLAAIQNKEGETTFNLLSEPRLHSVTPESTTFIHVSTNKFNPSKVTDGFSVDNDGVIQKYAPSAVSVPYMVKPGEKWTSRGIQQVSFYDSEDNFIVRNGLDTNTMNTKYTFTVPNNAFIVRFNIFINHSNMIPKEEIQLNEGSDLLTYEPYFDPTMDSNIRLPLPPDGSLDTKKYADGSVTKEKVDFISDQITTNLFNPEQVVRGKFIYSNNGKLFDAGENSIAYGEGEFINVEPNEKYTMNNDGTLVVVWFDINKLFIKSGTSIAPVDGEQIPYTVTSPPNAKYMKVAISDLFGLFESFRINKGSTLLPYEPFFEPHSLLDKNVKIDPSSLLGSPEQQTNLYSANPFLTPNPVGAYDGTENEEIESLTTNQMYAKYDDLIGEYPNNLTKKVLGKNESGEHDIVEIVYKPLLPLKPKLKVLLEANIHGSSSDGDPQHPTVAIYELLKQICDFSGNNSAINFLKFNVELRIIPIANPWGFDNANRMNSNLVDLNRNFTSSTPEAETTIIKNWVNSNLNADCFLGVHAYGSGNTQNNLATMYSVGSSDEFIEALDEANMYSSQSLQSARIFRQLEQPAADRESVGWVGTKGISSTTLEFPVYGNIHGYNTSKTLTHYVEWIGNVLYRYALKSLN